MSLKEKFFSDWTKEKFLKYAEEKEGDIWWDMYDDILDDLFYSEYEDLYGNMPVDEAEELRSFIAELWVLDSYSE